jgi:hypothetical protein
MKPVLASIIFAFFLFLMGGCIRNEAPKILKRTELDGINGPAYYYISKDGIVEKVVKKEHADNQEFSIAIEKDTIIINKEFAANFSAHTDEYLVVIESPQPDTLYGFHSPKKSPYLHKFERYVFRPEHIGAYDMRGYIKFDSTIIKFEYKFLVM